MILEDLRKKCSGDMRILFPEVDERILGAADAIKKEGLAKPIVVSKEADIDPESDKNYKEFVKQFYELRKHKGVTEDQAREAVKNPITFSALMIKNNLADGIVLGASLSAAESLIPILQVIKPKQGKASSHFLMVKEDALVFADCAIIEHPDNSDLVDITKHAVQAAKAYGLKPRVAMLSYVTGKVKLTNVTAATEVLKKELDCPVEGEIQFDAAYVKEIGEKKGKNLAIKGDANVFIFPDLASGNISYKIAERLGKYKAIGPIIQGLPNPISYLSRGCSVQDIIDAVVVISSRKVL